MILENQEVKVNMKHSYIWNNLLFQSVCRADRAKYSFTLQKWTYIKSKCFLCCFILGLKIAAIAEKLASEK